MSMRQDGSVPWQEWAMPLTLGIAFGAALAVIVFAVARG